MLNHIWPTTAGINQQNHLEIGGYDAVTLAHEYGTPLYVLDEATFRGNCCAYRDAFARHYPGVYTVHYASKALLNTAVVQLVQDEELSLDVVSGGELWVALRAGFPAERIHLHGNAKPQAELEAALAAEIGNIVVDTLDELRLLAQLTASRRVPQSILIRIAPGVAADTHAHIQTGHADSKFGLPLDQLDAAAAVVRAAPGLRLHGLHCHLGSQLFDPAPYPHAIDVLLDTAAYLRQAHGIELHEISPGGGLGVPYTAEQQTPDLDVFAATISRAMIEGCATRQLPLPTLIVEPGRSIVARAGVALYRVVARKWFGTVEDGGWTEESAHTAYRPPSTIGYVHIDGGMADNIRPALYGAQYTAIVANRANDAPTEQVHVAGRYCESGDVLLRDIRLPHAEIGDTLAIATAGAYTLSMASNYNLVPRPALLLLNNGQARVIQRRETYEDLVRRDERIR